MRWLPVHLSSLQVVAAASLAVVVVAVVIVDIMVVVRVFQFGFSFVYFRQTFSSFRLTFKCLSCCALFWFLFFGSCYCCVAVYTTLAVARHYVVRLILL